MKRKLILVALVVILTTNIFPLFSHRAMASPEYQGCITASGWSYTTTPRRFGGVDRHWFLYFYAPFNSNFEAWRRYGGPWYARINKYHGRNGDYVLYGIRWEGENPPANFREYYICPP